MTAEAKQDLSETVELRSVAEEISRYKPAFQVEDKPYDFDRKRSCARLEIAILPDHNGQNMPIHDVADCADRLSRILRSLGCTDTQTSIEFSEKNSQMSFFVDPDHIAALWEVAGALQQKRADAPAPHQ